MSLTKREKKRKKNFHCLDTKILVWKPFLSKNVFIFENGLFKAFLNRNINYDILRIIFLNFILESYNKLHLLILNEHPP